MCHPPGTCSLGLIAGGILGHWEFETLGTWEVGTLGLIWMKAQIHLSLPLHLMCATTCKCGPFESPGIQNFGGLEWCDWMSRNGPKA
jgi:hypothetical protein